ncbi:phosphate ABC transporter permease subunit PstC [Dongia rigui]|uniref:phosphate ABC transporter permease subunit PstC n=1 Tax=Dongia rigui TaxID=940149 RepID=UPI0038993562
MAAGLLLLLSSVGFQLGRRRAFASVRGATRELHSLPSYHGVYVGLGAFLPGALALLLGAVIAHFLPGDPKAGHDVIWAAIAAATLGAAAIGLGWAQRHISANFRARNAVERMTMVLLVVCSLLSILTTVGIVLSLVFEAMRFFAQISPFEFLFGLQWSPQMAIRADQVGQSGAFGAIPVFAGTMLITVIAMAVAVPVGLMSAIYLSDYASRKTRAWAKPLIEILAGIPTVVYGFFAALTVAPLIRGAGAAVGLDVASESALAAGLVMGVMIIPFISSLSDDVMNAVPQAMRDGSFALGATKSETIRQVVVPAALPGIMGGVLLAVSRAIGETMIVVMAAGLTANLTANPLEAVTTVTVQIVTLLVGDQEFDSPKTLAAFALGLALFVVTLILNIVALRIVKKYREQYE